MSKVLKRSNSTQIFWLLLPQRIARVKTEFRTFYCQKDLFRSRKQKKVFSIHHLFCAVWHCIRVDDYDFVRCRCDWFQKGDT